MKHDDKHALNIEARLYDGLQLPSQEVVEVDCGRVLTRLKGDESLRRIWHEGGVRSDKPSAIAWRRLATLSAAAAVILAVWIGVLWQQPNLWKNDTSGIAKSADGTAYRVGEIVRSDGGQGTVMTLSDRSRVEMRTGSEASVEHAADGLSIRLNAGSIIVTAAKQAAGRHLYVQTRDVTVSVVGTVFLVKADAKGSQVAVIQGEVRVQQGTVEKQLRPGEQTSSSPEQETLAMQVEIGWSREAAAYLGMLHQSLAQTLAARQASPRAGPVSDKPQFEEASIRRCEQDFTAPEGMRGGGSNSLRLSRGRLDALCMTVATLLTTAHRPLNNNSQFPGISPALRLNMTYGLGMEDGTRVRGGPDWVRSEKYTIAAVADGSVSAETLQGPMLMELLERRLQMKIHLDVEQIPVYALTIGKDGLKMKPAERGSCVSGAAGYLRPVDGGGTFIDEAARQRQLEEYRRGATPSCGLSFHLTGPNVMQVGGEVTIRSLAQQLSALAQPPMLSISDALNGRLVVDKTGIPDTDRFNFVLEYAADEDAYSRIGMSPSSYPNIPKGPSVFAALEKLGLHLEKSTGSREFIVIDHIEKPSPN